MENELGPLGDRKQIQSLRIRGVLVQPGSPVRLHPTGRADILDLALGGKSASVESIEVDFEGRIHVAVILDDDPGRDLGRLGQPGHRFFYRPEEIEPLAGSARGIP